MKNFKQGSGGKRGGNFGSGRPSFGGGSGFGNKRPSYNSGPREMFAAVCSGCGNKCELPFRPTNNKPVFCNDCFAKNGGNDSRSNSFSKPREFGNKSGRNDRGNFKPMVSDKSGETLKNQIDLISKKIDDLISIVSKMQNTKTETAESSVVKKTVTKKAVVKKPARTAKQGVAVKPVAKKSAPKKVAKKAKK